MTMILENLRTMEKDLRKIGEQKLANRLHILRYKILHRQIGLESESMEKNAEKKYKMIIENREKFIEAFIAETGALPSECEMIEQEIRDVDFIGKTITIRKKIKPEVKVQITDIIDDAVDIYDISNEDRDANTWWYAKGKIDLANELKEKLSRPVQAGVSHDFCDFTEKQLNVISIAVERWLIEDTVIKGDYGRYYIDKINGNPTLLDRLKEASKNSG